MFTVNEITDEVVKRVKQALKIQQDINLDEDLTVLGLNSMDVMTLAIDLEDVYSIDFSPDELLHKHFSTIRNIVELIDKKKA